MKNERRAFLTEGAGIDPPSEDVVAKAEAIASTLATIAAEEAQASAIIQITTESLEAFKKLNA